MKKKKKEKMDKEKKRKEEEKKKWKNSVNLFPQGLWESRVGPIENDVVVAILE